MSRLIKSPYAKAATNNVKTIAIKNVYTAIDEKKPDKKQQTIIEDNEKTILAKYEEKAKEIIDAAYFEAEHVKTKAAEEVQRMMEQLEKEKAAVEQELFAMKENAKAEGHEEGYNNGYELAKNEFEHTIEEAQKVVELAKREYINKVKEAEPVILDLAIAVSEKIIGATLENEAGRWNTLIKQVIEEVRDHEEIKIYVHPFWYEKTLQQKDELTTLLSSNEELSIYPDAQLNENGCVIETPFGRIDASVDSQLAEIKKVLYEKLKEEGDGTSSSS